MFDIEFAKEVLTCYILSNTSYDIYIFLNELGITLDDFNNYIKIVKREDKLLYKNYLLKFKNNRVKRYYQLVDICKDIAFAIQTGRFKDDTLFDMFEFFKRVPFAGEIGKKEFRDCTELNPAISKSTSLFDKIDKFTEVADYDSNVIIVDFLRKNRIYRVRETSELNLKKLYGNMARYYKKVIDKNGNEIIIDRELTNDDINNVIKYINDNKLPFIIPVFNLVLEKYFTGEIIIEELKTYQLVIKK